MSQLTRVAYFSRKLIKFGLLGLVGLIALIPLTRAGMAWWQDAHPEPPPPPNTAFGQLPAINFGLTEANPADFTFRLETIQGNLPNLAGQARVYFIPILGPKFFDPDKTRRKAQLLGFEDEKGKITQNRFLFQNPQTNATLEIDTINNNFEINYPWQSDLFFQSLTPPTQNSSLSMARSLLSRVDLWHEDYDVEKTEYIYLQYNKNSHKLVKALSYSEGQLTRVNLFRKSLDNFPVLPPHPNESNTSFIFSSGTGKKSIIFAKHRYFDVNYEEFASYPLKTSTTAWQELQSGQGFIARLGNNNKDNAIIIRDIYLAYLDPETAQNYLQPIFVFAGDKDFMAYVPALDSSWIQKED